MSMALVTAIYGVDYDHLQPFVDQSIPVDAVCVTDDPNLESYCWRVIYEPRPDVHPNRAAKRAKMCPWLYTEATQSVWIDAAFRVISPTFAADMQSFADPIGQFVHPWRDDIYDEAEVSMGMGKYMSEPIVQQVNAYRALGMPGHWGLWATGVITRRHTSQVQRFGERWLQECHQWSFQDQVSEPLALWHCGLRPTSIEPGGVYGNDWLSYEASGRHG